MGGINIECFYLTASVERPNPEFIPVELVGPEPEAGALLESRPAYWGGLGGFKETEVYDFGKLKPGRTWSVVRPSSRPMTPTYVIEPDWKFTLDQYFNGVLTKI